MLPSPSVPASIPSFLLTVAHSTPPSCTHAVHSTPCHALLPPPPPLFLQDPPLAPRSPHPTRTWGGRAAGVNGTRDGGSPSPSLAQSIVHTVTQSVPAMHTPAPHVPASRRPRATSDASNGLPQFRPQRDSAASVGSSTTSPPAMLEHAAIVVEDVDATPESRFSRFRRSHRSSAATAVGEGRATRLSKDALKRFDAQTASQPPCVPQKKEAERKRGRERDRERQRQRQRQRQRETDRQRDRQTETETETKKWRDWDRAIHTHTHHHTYAHTHTITHMHIQSLPLPRLRVVCFKVAIARAKCRFWRERSNRYHVFGRLVCIWPPPRGRH